MTMRFEVARSRRGATRLLLIVVASMAAASPASAAPILDLVTTGSLTMTQGTTGTLAIRVTNSGTTAIDLAGMSIGLQVVADGFVSNSLTLSGFTGTNTAWTDPAPADPENATLTSGTLNGTTNFFSMSISGSYALEPSTTAVLGTVVFTATEFAEGIWKLWAVNEWPEDGFQVTAVDDEAFQQQQFANLTATEGGPGVALQIGTITVVPEPSAVAVLGAAAAVLGGVRVVRARRARARLTQAADR